MTFVKGEPRSRGRATETHCANQHPWTVENTRWARGPGVGRRCTLCEAAWRGDNHHQKQVAKVRPRRTKQAAVPVDMIQQARYEMELEFRKRRDATRREALSPLVQAALEREPTYREKLSYMIGNSDLG